MVKLCANSSESTTFLIVLAGFLFTKSETELDYYHQKVNVSVVSQAAEQINT